MVISASPEIKGRAQSHFTEMAREFEEFWHRVDVLRAEGAGEQAIALAKPPVLPADEGYLWSLTGLSKGVLNQQVVRYSGGVHITDKIPLYPHERAVAGSIFPVHSGNGVIIEASGAGLDPQVAIEFLHLSSEPVVINSGRLVLSQLAIPKGIANLTVPV